MIHCLLIQITQSPRGLEIRQERDISFERLTVGRGSDCKVYLPDYRVALHHASIQHGEDGKLYISAEASRTIEVDGYLEEVAALKPNMQIIVGPYLLKVEAMDGKDHIRISYQLTQEATLMTQPRLATNLVATGLSMRRPALWLAAIIALIFLVLPMTYSLNPWFQHVAQKIHLPLNEPLNAGHLSPGHLALSIK